MVIAISIWIIIIVGMIVLEAISTQMVGIWFAVAALISLVLALFNAEVWIQIVVFIVSSALLLILTRPISKKLLKGSPEHTNADRVVGETAVVIEEIDNDAAKGQVKVLGQTWSARSHEGDIIPAQEKVKIVSIDGVKLIVDKQAQTANKTENKENQEVTS